MERIKGYGLYIEDSWKQGSRLRRAWIFFCLYTLLFLSAFALAYSPFLLAGKSFIQSGDGRNQHYPALIYIGRYLRQVILSIMNNAPEIPLFDLSLGMGGDILSTLNYYGFGDPLNLLAVFVPTRYIEYLYNVLIVLRIYLAGLSFCALCVYHQKRPACALVGSFIYIYGGYAVHMAIRHPSFMNPMIQLPLLLIGIDRIIKRRKPFLFIFSVFYSALCGFYFLYMMTVMLGVYTLIRFFDIYTAQRLKEFMRMAGRIIESYLLGIGLSCALFIPAVTGFLGSSRSGENIQRSYLSYGWSYYRKNLPLLIAPCGELESFSLAAIVLFALVLLLFSGRKKYRSLKLLLAAAFITYLLPLGGYIMNGFAYPSQRWVFGFLCLLSYITVEMLPQLLTLNLKQKRLCLFALLLYTVLAFAGAKSRASHLAVGAAMLALTFSVLLVFQSGGKWSEKNRKQIGTAACILLVIGNVSVNTVYKFAKDQDNYAGQFSAYGVETDRIETAIEQKAGPYLKKLSGRFDSPSFNRNIGAVWHVPTLHTYWSITNSSLFDLYLKTENSRQRSGGFCFDGADQRTIMNALLSVRYFMDTSKSASCLPYGYLPVKTAGGSTIYENQYALPWGYTYDSQISYEELEKMNGLEKEEAMLQAIALEDSIGGLPHKAIESHIQKIPYEITKSDHVTLEDGKLSVQKANASITLKYQMPEKAEGYLRLQGLDINDSGVGLLSITAESSGVIKNAASLSNRSNSYYGRKNYLFNLGYCEEERTGCTITFSAKGSFKLDSLELFALPMQNYAEQAEALRKEPLKNIRFDTNRITGTLELSQSKILCLSIPYSEGWSAKVDGKKADILRGNILFMAIALDEGYHEIELSYFTPGLKAGLLVSAASVILLSFLLILGRNSKISGK